MPLGCCLPYICKYASIERLLKKDLQSSNKLGGEVRENTEEIGVDSRVLFGIIAVWENTAAGQIGITIPLQNAISPN